MFGIANLKALSARRYFAQPKRSSVLLVEDAALQRFADPDDPHERMDDREDLARLMIAIERLPEGQRDVLRLAFVEGHSYQEVALELGITEGNVKTRVNRARSRLRALARPNPVSG